MIQTKKTSYPPINIGTSFMLVIFIILCMVIFAVLSFSGAMKDLSYSERNALRTTAYYTANNEAQRILAVIDSVLSEYSTEEGPEMASAIKQQLTSALKDTAAAELTVEPLEGTEEISISFFVPIGDAEAIEAVLLTRLGQQKSYTIATWKQVSTLEWTGSQTLPVLGSD